MAAGARLHLIRPLGSRWRAAILNGPDWTAGSSLIWRFTRTGRPFSAPTPRPHLSPPQQSRQTLHPPRLVQPPTQTSLHPSAHLIPHPLSRPHLIGRSGFTRPRPPAASIVHCWGSWPTWCQAGKPPDCPKICSKARPGSACASRLSPRPRPLNLSVAVGAAAYQVPRQNRYECQAASDPRRHLFSPPAPNAATAEQTESNS